MVGLAVTPATSASLLLNLEGVFTALLAWFVFKENFDRRIALGMAAITSGGLFISWAGRLEMGVLWGTLAISGACLAWAIDNNLTGKVSAGDPVQIAAAKGLVAGVVNLTIALATGAHVPTFLTVTFPALAVLVRAKRRVARSIKSRALMADSKQTEFCTYLSAILLVGLLLNALVGWWWADPVAALIMVPIIVKEGIGGLRGETCCEEH